jgi:hypothetical protein
MISKRSLRFVVFFIHIPCDNKIGICAYTEIVFITVSKPPSAEHTRKHNFAQAFRQRHYGSKRVCWWATHKNAYPQRLTRSIGLCLMNANSTMDLVMKPNFFI